MAVPLYLYLRVGRLITEVTDYYPQLSTFQTGWRCACPRCGRGRLFEGLLTVRRACSECGLDYSLLDSQDGPAFFIIVVYSAVLIPLALWLEFAVSPPLWVHVALWGPIILGGSVLLLRPLKAWLMAQQYRHKAYEDAPR